MGYRLVWRICLYKELPAESHLDGIWRYSYIHQKPEKSPTWGAIEVTHGYNHGKTPMLGYNLM
jgi:hypothetical protein